MNAVIRLLLITCLCLPVSVLAATVRTALLGSLLTPVRYSAPAEVVQRDHPVLSSRITGQVENVAVQVGDAVDAGAVLMQLDCADYQLQHQLRNAEQVALVAQHRLAKQQLQRAQQLLKQRNASRELYDQRKAALARLQAQLEGSEARLALAALSVSRCDIRAPFAGVVTARLASTGSYVVEGAGLIRLLRLDGLEVRAALSTTEEAALRQAAEFWLHVDNKNYPLQLRTVLPHVDNRARTRTVLLDFVDNTALAGSRGRLVWQDGRQQLPPRYRVQRGERVGLMLWTEGKAQFYPLPAAIEGQPAVVDLPADTELIIEGQFSLRDGETVQRLKVESP